MSIGSKVARSVSIQILGRGISMVFGLIAVAVLARKLGVSGYGSYTTVFAYANFLAVVADFGFFNVLMRELSLKEEGQAPHIVNNILTFRTLFAIIIYGGGFLLSFLFPYSSQIKWGIGLISLSLFLLTLSLTLIGLFQVRQQMGRSVVADLVGKATTTILILILLALHQGLIVVLIAYVVGNLLTLLINIYFARPYVRLRPAFDQRYWREFAPQALSMGIFTVFSFIYFHIDMVVLSLQKSQAEVGMYGAAYKLIELILVFSGIFSGAVFPVFTKSASKGRQQLNRQVQLSGDLLLVVGIYTAVAVFILAKPIIAFIAGQEFIQASVPGIHFFGHPLSAVLALQILVIAVVISFFSSLINTVVMALGEQRRLLAPAIGVTIVNFLLNIFYIPRFSFLAASLITVACELLIIVYPLLILYREAVKIPTLHLLPKVVVASLGMAAFLLVGIHLPFLIALALGTAVYVLILIAVKGVPTEFVKGFGDA